MAKPTLFLFDFPAFIEELRSKDEKKEIIEKYEKYVLNGEKITGDIKDQKWYKDYLSKFQPVPNYKVPEDLEDDFDWALLFQLIAGSFSSVYRLSYPQADEDKSILPELLIKVSHGDATAEKTVSELWSFQVLKLFEIYIEEQIHTLVLTCESSEYEQSINSFRKTNLRKFITLNETKQYLFDFQSYIEELRTTKGEDNIIQKYEECVLRGNKIDGDIKDQKWYKDYLSKFQPVPIYKVPKDIESDYDWALLFQLVAGSFSSTYRLSYPTVKEGEITLPELLIKVDSDSKTAEKTISELDSFQIIPLFEIYINEQIAIESLCCEDKGERQKLSRLKEANIRKYKRYTNVPTKSRTKVKKTEDPYIAAHYCSLQSAKHILSSGKIFSSDLSYMNDKDEFTFGIDIMLTALEKLANKKDINNGLRSKFKELLQKSSKLKKDLVEKPVFISCFSTKQDDLNQWRAYGDNGFGVSIVFDFNKSLNELGKNKSDGFIMKRVKYLTKEYKPNNKQWIELIQMVKDQFEYAFNAVDAKKPLDYLTSDLKTNIRFYKNEKFSEESEFRQVCLNEDNKYQVKTRVGKEYLIPFIDLDVDNKFDESSIIGIIIGPSVKDFEKSKKSFELYIDQINKEKTIGKATTIINSAIDRLEPVFIPRKAFTSLENNLKKLKTAPTREIVITKAKDFFITFMKEVISMGLDPNTGIKIQGDTLKVLDDALDYVYLKDIKISQSTIPYLP